MDLPSLESLECFEAAARLGGFTAAARELSLPQSSVSRRIQALEVLLGRQLFRRYGRRVELTRRGAAYAERVRTILDGLRGATLEVIAPEIVSGTLRLVTHPTFAARWVIPRLGAFTKRHPGVEIQLRSEVVVDLSVDTAFEVAILINPRRSEGLVYRPLVRETVVPVAAPGFVDPELIGNPAALLDLPRIHSTVRPEAWSGWFKRHGLEPPELVTGPGFDLIQHLTQAALAGLGIALLPEVLIEQELEEGRLTRLHPQGMQLEDAYFVTYRETDLGRPDVGAFVPWLLEKADGVGSIAT